MLLDCCSIRVSAVLLWESSLLFVVAVDNGQWAVDAYHVSRITYLSYLLLQALCYQKTSKKANNESKIRDWLKPEKLTNDKYSYPSQDLHLHATVPMVLSEEEITGCREAFLSFDKDRSGTIDVWELRQVLEALGQAPTEDELFQMISEVDENMSGSIDFGEFLKVVEHQKERNDNVDDEEEMVDAFVACGGNEDRSGVVQKDTLVKIIKHDFGLTIDIEELVNKIDTDGSGEIEYGEFSVLLTA
eukprot:scaffold4289_cov246-Chaetoceros_neogracile.AAC.4